MDYLQYQSIIKTGEVSLKNRFKPYYKWITFNILDRRLNNRLNVVLNLIINGLPSI